MFRSLDEPRWTCNQTIMWKRKKEKERERKRKKEKERERKRKKEKERERKRKKEKITLVGPAHGVNLLGTPVGPLR